MYLCLKDVACGGQIVSSVDIQCQWWTGNVYGGQIFTVADRQQWQICSLQSLFSLSCVHEIMMCPQPAVVPVASF